MSNKLYVGNLSWDVSDDDLARVFADSGTVQSATVITDKHSGRSKGFGFVEMSSDEEAQAAIEKLDGAEMMGRNIRVSVARPKEDRPDRNFDRR